MEGLVTITPFFVGHCVAFFDIVLTGQILIQFSVAQIIESSPQFQFSWRTRLRIHAVLGLHFAEFAKGAVGDFGAFLDTGKGQLS